MTVAFITAPRSWFKTARLLSQRTGIGLFEGYNRWVFDTVAAQTALWEYSDVPEAGLRAFSDTVYNRVLSAYSGGFSVGIDEHYISSGQLNVLNADNDVSISPNPFNSATVISAKSKGTLNIYDSRGKLVERFFVDSGESMVFDASHLSSGSYLARFVTENKEVSEIKLLLVK
jgi:hypothetical protein